MHDKIEKPGHASIQRIQGIDGIRAIAILLVLIAHGQSTVSTSVAWLHTVALFLGNAALGVTTFFVISGYLITTLLRREWERSGSISLKSFYMRRVLRIFPALYTYLLVLTLLRAIGWIGTTWADLGIAGTFLTNYKHLLAIPTNVDYWYVGHFWTLSLEEQFYLLWPAAILIFSMSRAPHIALAIVLLSPVMRVVSYYLWPSVRPQLTLMLHTGADPIMFGCLLALCEKRRIFERIMVFVAWPGWPLIAGVFLIVLSPWLASRFRGAYAVPIGITINSFSIAFVLSWLIRNPASVIGRFLNCRVMRHIGVLSYSLYLWQQLFLTELNTSWTGAFPLNFLCCFVAAEMSYWIIEKPFLRLRRRFQPPLKSLNLDNA